MITLLIALIVVPVEESYNLDLLVVNDVVYLHEGQWRHSYRKLVPIEWVNGKWNCLGYWEVLKDKSPLLQPDGSYKYLTVSRLSDTLMCIKSKFVLFLTTDYDIESDLTRVRRIQGGRVIEGNLK